KGRRQAGGWNNSYVSSIVITRLVRVIHPSTPAEPWIARTSRAMTIVGETIAPSPPSLPGSSRQSISHPPGVAPALSRGPYRDPATISRLSPPPDPLRGPPSPQGGGEDRAETVVL